MNVPLNISLQQILLHLFNFAILAFGLYFLLYKPVKDFMEKRKDHYAAMQNEAEAHLAKAKENEEEYSLRLKGAEEEIAAMRRAAAAEAEAAAQRSMAEAEAKADKLMAEARENARREADKLIAEAQDSVSEMAVAAVSKLLGESLSRSYDDFLSAAERSELHEQN